MNGVKASIIGFGNVGRSLLRELLKLDSVEVVSASSSRGSVIIEDKGDLDRLKDLASTGARLDSHPSFIEGLGPLEAVSRAGAELAFIAIPPSYETGEPNRSIYTSLVELGVSIITADKTVLAKWYSEFMERARGRVYVGFRATVAAGIPAIDSARGLRGRGVEVVEAVLNSTTNYIITLVEGGLSYSEAVEKAIREELAEPDPRVDTHGLDPAAKLAILLSVMGYSVSLDDVERVPLEEALSSVEAVERLRRGEVLRYIAWGRPGEGVYRVEPRWLPKNHPLAGVSGIYNGILYRLENERIYLEGPVGPAWRTARVMVTDLLEYMGEWRRGV